LSPIVWEQRVGRIFRLGQRADRIQVAHLTVSESAESKVLEIYSEALGLFTLPIGEASVVLDYLADPRLRDIESPIRALLRNPVVDEALVDELSDALSAARNAYDRTSAEAAMLDDIFFGGGASA
jgi:hypothetical protein